jgi:formylglycine-generating enzyme required for sulfatase activity
MKNKIITILVFSISSMMLLLSCLSGSKIIKTSNPDLGEFVFVKGANFLMGNTPEQELDSKTVKSNFIDYDTATINVKDFYMAKTELTQAQWQAVMGTNPSKHKCSECPVENISSNDIKEFLKIINLNSKRKYRLPTIHEWDFAARGGKLSKAYKYAGSNDIDAVAWYKKNSNDSTHPVAQKIPNELGLYDMSGNAMEFCNDKIDRSLPFSEMDYSRGGSYRFDSTLCISGYLSLRFFYDLTPPDNNSYTGFRLLMEAKK